MTRASALGSEARHAHMLRGIVRVESHLNDFRNECVTTLSGLYNEGPTKKFPVWIVGKDL